MESFREREREREHQIVYPESKALNEKCRMIAEWKALQILLKSALNFSESKSQIIKLKISSLFECVSPFCVT